jgi:hypothetical protein
MLRRSRALLALSLLGVLVLSGGGLAEAQKQRPGAARVAPQRGARGNPAALATATDIRVRSDGMARAIRKGGRTDGEVQRYVRQELKRDAQLAFGTLARLQQGGEVDAVTEHRAIAAVGRLLHAASQLDTRFVDSELRDSYDALSSRAEFRRKAPNHETAVEIETQMTGKIVDALTTRDGTVGPILREGGKKPPRFLTWKAGLRGSVEDVRWDSLSRQQKLDVLRSQSRGRQFFASRLIPGVKFRRAIAKPTSARVLLGGKVAEPGTDTVSVDGVLMDKVEFMGPKAVDDVSGVEMHIRQKGPAGRNARDAFTVAALLDSPARAGHQHMPVRIPSRVMKGDPLERAMLVDFYRRSNMVGELESVLDGYALSPVRDGAVTYFDFLQADGLSAMNQHLDSMARTGRPALGNDSLKMGAVGFRTGELYGDRKMIGFEVRTLSKDRVQSRDVFVDAVQKGLLTGKYGLARSTFARWHDAAVGESATASAQGRALAGLHYNRSVGALLADAPADLQAALGGKAGQRIRAEADKAYGLKMLVHDWGRDPALGGDAAARRTVRAAQLKGLERLAAGADAHDVTRRFVKESGLYDTFSRSIGMGDPSLRR